MILLPRFVFACRRFVFSQLLGLVFSAGVLFAAPVKFDIPAQSAAPALQAFIKQSGAQVLYAVDEVKDARTNAVVGAYEPAAGLALLLKNTALTFKPRGEPGWFVVARATPATGSVEGTLRSSARGKSITGVVVTAIETGTTAAVSGGGVFRFPGLPPGTYTLVAAGEGFSRLRITDVVVRSATDLVLGPQEMPSLLKDGEVQTMKEIVVSARKDIETLAALEVSEGKVKPFATGNMDIPRTIDDVQPYYIFDSQTIDQSGAGNVDEFLKQRLTMNATARSGNQAPTGLQGNASLIDLRGLGSDKTLVLINGRRVAGAARDTISVGNLGQADLNAIPLAAIERIEVLPASASGIYGGNALGGVVNVIMKRNYSGGEIRATYDNSFSSDSARRILAMSYGLPLEGGKTHLTMSVGWTQNSDLLLQDRAGPYRQAITRIAKSGSTLFYSTTNPILGSLPNIVSSGTLTLKNGVVLPSNMTYVGAGITAATPAADLYASLRANAGSWNLEPPNSLAAPTGLLQNITSVPTTKSFTASLRRQMSSRIEIFADFSYASTELKAAYSPISTVHTVPANSPVNPFTTAVTVRFSDFTPGRYENSLFNRSLTTGAIVQLPGNWTSEFDYTRSDSRGSNQAGVFDNTARVADLASGALNLFVDPRISRPDFSKYVGTQKTFGVGSVLNDFALRGSGPIGSLPWGRPTLTVGLEYRFADISSGTLTSIYPATPASNLFQRYFDKRQVTESGYGEAIVPLVKKDLLPGLHALELQVAGRSEHYKIDTGTLLYSISGTGVTTYSPTSSQPFFSNTSYESNNATAGLKYQPVSEVTVRASTGTAFLPPTPGQLVTNPQPATTLTSVIDPKTNTSVSVQTLSGGNASLKPQNSQSFNAGIIWQPKNRLLNGLRFNLEYYRITQDDAISTLSAQQIVGLESVYPDRVTRDASGKITLVNISSLNLYQRESEAIDLSIDYTLRTAIGAFTLNGATTRTLHLKTQYSLTLPAYEATGYAPAESGTPKYKASTTLTWTQRGWTAAWTARYVDSYKQYGAPGGPNSMQSFGGGPNLPYLIAQGSDSVSSQNYHDVFFSYAFGRETRSGSGLRAWTSPFLDRLTVQLGVKNVLNQLPPFDAYQSGTGTYYFSPYGDLRLRTYWLSVKKAF